MAATSLLKCLVVPPASGQAPTATLIFAHGLGDTGLGWLDVAKMLSRRPGLRHVRFVLPNAPVQPVTLNMGMSMPSWFDISSLEDIEEGEDEKGLLKSASAIKSLIAGEIDGSADGLAGKGISPERVVVGGFSQVSRRRSQPRHTRSGHRFRTGREFSTLSRVQQSLKEETLRRVATESAAASAGHRIAGIGVDLFHLPRLSELRTHESVDAKLQHFARRILCSEEREGFDALRESTECDKLKSWLAVRFAAKEAAYKALQPGLRPTWHNLRVSKRGSKPVIELCGAMANEDSLQPELHLSITHDGDYVGGAISYLAGLTANPPVGGIVGLSTWLPLHRKIGDLVTSQAKSIPTFHGHGSADPIVGFEYGKRTAEYLKDKLGMGSFQAGQPPTGLRFEIYPGMPHSACPEEIEHVGEFLEKVIPAQ